MKSRSFNLFVVLALFLSLLGGAVTITPAYAAGIVVNSNADDTLVNLNGNGTCDLREAITNANNDDQSGSTECPSGAGADNITFAANYTITLIGSQLPVISTPMTITGKGAANTIIQANAAANTATYRVFEVDGIGNLTLDSLTVRHGRCNGSCNSFSNIGGGIFNNGTLTITNSTISNNSASGTGGGIFNLSILTLSNSTLSNNSASDGGGMFNSGNSATLTNVTFNSNSATINGGGIGSNAGNLSLTNVTFNSNIATQNGGGIYTDSNATLTQVTFSGNSAFSGGGMYSGNISTLTNVTFSSNSATSRGGGMYNNSSSTLTEVTFSGNSAAEGGGMYSNTSNLTKVTFSSNSATSLGGGMYNNGSSTLTQVTLSGNSATSGGGIYVNSGSVEVIDSTLSSNTATTSGGGIYNLINTLKVNNVTFETNSAANGGGIFNQASSPTLTNVTFSANSATFGGGMANNNNSNPTLNNVTFSGNQAINGGNGGGINNFFSAPILTNVIIANSTGGNCDGANLPNGSSSNNLIDDTSCSGVGILTDGANGNKIGASYSINLGSLANNGGFTQTHALLSGSDAIDAGSGCAATDQRGVTRPQGAGCDIGAFETGPIIPVVTASNPSANAVLTSLTSITVVFNQDMLNDGSAKAANNTVNYLLVERGTNGSFDTTSCNGGVVSDDVQQTISTASYSNVGFISTLTLASPLAAGTYRLFVCGTTSIWSAAGLELNNGASDYTADFTIGAAAGTGRSGNRASTTASSLPKTGFAPKKITTLPAQPATLAYTKLGDLWLEIPSLNVKSTIVGVPQNADKTWDVSWLGNDTGWLNGTAFPTWNGNSVLTAHVTNASGLDGPFAALKSLKYGDQVIVHVGGVKYVYEVRETKLARPYSTNYAFESKQDASYLTLITCQGFNPLNDSYLFRRVVRAVLVEVK